MHAAANLRAGVCFTGPFSRAPFAPFAITDGEVSASLVLGFIPTMYNRGKAFHDSEVSLTPPPESRILESLCGVAPGVCVNHPDPASKPPSENAFEEIPGTGHLLLERRLSPVESGTQ